MRIVAGALRGRVLIAPPGQTTRPTSDRVRQALFDMLMHADWGGRDVFDGAAVLDVFAGTGALGLEALSRGAGFVSFFEQDPAALKALRVNVAACKAEPRVEIVGGDVMCLPSRSATALVAPRRAASVVFLDPPYGQDLIPGAISRLLEAGRIAPGALVVAETGCDETWLPLDPLLAERAYGAARIVVFRLP